MPAVRFVLLGPTASGKTEVSLFVACDLGAEIISVDSRQVYRGMEIGSAAPTPEERERVPHHMVGTADPEEVLTAGEYGRRARTAEGEIRERGREVLFVGGSGLYLRAVLGGLDDLPRDENLRAVLRNRVREEGAEALHAELERRDPETAAAVSVRDVQRITRALEILELTGRKASELRRQGREAETVARIAVLDRNREDLENRIRARVAKMIEGGLESEVKALLHRGLDPAIPALRSVGYAETARYLRGELEREEWMEEIAINTRRLAKRQRTWFRGLPGARWIPVAAAESAEAVARKIDFGGGVW